VHFASEEAIEFTVLLLAARHYGILFNNLVDMLEDEAAIQNGCEVNSRHEDDDARESDTVSVSAFQDARDAHVSTCFCLSQLRYSVLRLR
jgi:hypothetical protein